jgi:hypothetical protein
MGLHLEVRSCFRGLLAVANRRGFRISAANFKNPEPSSVTPKSTVTETLKKADNEEQKPADSGRFVVQNRRTPTAMDRYFLVWSGQFKSKDEIPAQLEAFRIIKAREWGRIRINIYILFLAAGLSGVAVYAGKQAAKRGESVEGDNLAWHKKINEEYRQEQERAKKA